MGDWARIHQRFGKNSNEVTKRGNLTNGNYKKMANFGKNGEFKSFWPNRNEMTKKEHLDK